MNIDIFDLVNHKKNEISVNEEIIIQEEILKETLIRKLENCFFEGKIDKIIDNDYNLSGVIRGTMILPDDITLEDVAYDFTSEINENFTETDENNDNNLKIIQNTLDILPILWQNILVEIPLKVTSGKEVDLKGNGWRLITEEELKEEKSNNSPFSNLEKLLNERKE